MSLKLRLQDDMKAAMKAKAATTLSTLRMLLAAMKQREVDERIELSDTDIIAIIDKMIKQRRDAADQMDQGGRPELAQRERDEIVVLQGYRPAMLDENAINDLIEQAVANLSVSGPAAMGPLMAALKPALAGQADMVLVSKLVKARLARTEG